MIHTSVADQIDPRTAVFLTLLLWILFIIVLLAQIQRAKVRKRKYARAAAILNRREAFIKAANEKDDKENEARNNEKPQKRDRR